MRCILCDARNHHNGSTLVADHTNRWIRFGVTGRRSTRNRTSRTTLAFVAETQRFGGRLLCDLDACICPYRTEATVTVCSRCRGGIVLRLVVLLGVWHCGLHMTVIHFEIVYDVSGCHKLDRPSLCCVRLVKLRSGLPLSLKFDAIIASQVCGWFSVIVAAFA